MSKYTYLQPITAAPHQLARDLDAFGLREGNHHNRQPSLLAALARRGWGDTLEAIRKTALRLQQLREEAMGLAVQNVPDPRTQQWQAHLAEAGIPTEKAALAAWFAAMNPSGPAQHAAATSRPADYYDQEPIELWGLRWIELPPHCRTGSFSKAVTKAYASPTIAVQELTSRAQRPEGDLLLKRGYDCRWQVWQRRQVTGRGYSPMGSFAKKAALGEGRLFIQ